MNYFRIRHGSASLQGHRSNNEDCVRVEEFGYDRIAIVSDGLGGHANGEIASRWCCEALLVLLSMQAPADWRMQDPADTPPTPDVYTGVAQPGDVFVLASDGLDELIDGGQSAKLASRLRASLSRGDIDLDALCKRVAKAAIDAGSQDNVTMAIVVVEDDAVGATK